MLDQPLPAIESADFLVVSDGKDALTSMFLDFAASQGHTGVDVHPLGFARLVSVEVDGTGPRVAPALPLLLRPLPVFPATADEETRFHWSECYAACWAAASLVPRPSLNRPTAWGWATRITASNALLECRVRGASAAPELFWTGTPPTDAGDGEWLHQDLETWATIDTPGPGFYRSRRFPRCRGWEQVIVVGARGLRVTSADIGDRELEAASVAVAAKLAASFATVSWGIPEDDSPAVLARLNPFPSMHEIGPVWPDVRRLLLGELMAS